MFKFPKARKQYHNQVLFNNKKNVKVRVKVKVFAGDLEVWLKLPFQFKLIKNRYGIPNRNYTRKRRSNTGKNRINRNRNQINKNMNPMCRNRKGNSTSNPKGNNTGHLNFKNTAKYRPIFYT